MAGLTQRRAVVGGAFAVVVALSALAADLLDQPSPVLARVTTPTASATMGAESPVPTLTPSETAGPNVKGIEPQPPNATANGGASEPAMPVSSATTSLAHPSALCYFTYQLGALTQDPPGQIVTFTAQRGLQSEATACAEDRTMFWASYVWRPDGSRALFASETFVLTPANPAYTTVLYWESYCHGGMSFVAGMPILATIPAGQNFPYPSYDGTTGKGHIHTSAPPNFCAATPTAES